jgi:hypothetical protein
MSTVQKVISQKIDLTEIEAIVITEITTDPDTGEYLRAIRIFGSTGTSKPAAVEIVARSDSAEKLKVDLPDDLSF